MLIKYISKNLSTIGNAVILNQWNKIAKYIK